MLQLNDARRAWDQLDEHARDQVRSFVKDEVSRIRALGNAPPELCSRWADLARAVNVKVERSVGTRSTELTLKDPQDMSTSVLVLEEQIRRLRELSLRTRVGQSKYLREVVDDLLSKYGKLPDPKR